jgi:hypothetical protein
MGGRRKNRMGSRITSRGSGERGKITLEIICQGYFLLYWKFVTFLRIDA